MTYRVEIIRDETRAAAVMSVEITAYIEREPEPTEAGFGKLARALVGVWNSRLLISGDFDSLADALAAIEAAYPDVARIACYEWSVDDENPLEMPPLLRAGGKWSLGPRPTVGAPPPQLAWETP